MNPDRPKMNKGNLKIATSDLVLMTLFASLGIARKNIVHPLIVVITELLCIPSAGKDGSWASFQ